MVLGNASLLGRLEFPASGQFDIARVVEQAAFSLDIREEVVPFLQSLVDEIDVMGDEPSMGAQPERLTLGVDVVPELAFDCRQ